MIKTLLSERHKSIVKKTNRNRYDSKFHEYGAKSNFDTCFKNVLSMTIINQTPQELLLQERTTFCAYYNSFHVSPLKNMVFPCISAKKLMWVKKLASDHLLASCSRHHLPFEKKQSSLKQLNVSQSYIYLIRKRPSQNINNIMQRQLLVSWFSSSTQ